MTTKTVSHKLKAWTAFFRFYISCDINIIDITILVTFEIKEKTNLQLEGRRSNSIKLFVVLYSGPGCLPLSIVLSKLRLREA